MGKKLEGLMWNVARTDMKTEKEKKKKIKKVDHHQTIEKSHTRHIER